MDLSFRVSERVSVQYVRIDGLEILGSLNTYYFVRIRR